MLIGIGYDAHRFKKGRKLVLGGVTIKSPKGLLGHSDADVLVHAIMDALLGAAGMDDIGHLFPDTAPKYKGISSITLLEEVIARLNKKKLAIENIDSVVIAEKPRISPYITRMKKILSKTSGISPKKITVKATTNEGMDFIGRGEGIAALAAALLKRK